MEKHRENSNLVDIVCNQIVETAKLGQGNISICAHYRISCEGWLKVELLTRLTALFLGKRIDAEVFPEYGIKRKKIDLAIQSPDELILLELKTFPTNYGKAGKPITNFIDGVKGDLEKLSEVREEATGLVAWLAYPIPDPPKTWPVHLAKIQAKAYRTLRVEQVDLFTPNEHAHLYVMESR